MTYQSLMFSPSSIGTQSDVNSRSVNCETRSSIIITSCTYTATAAIALLQSELRAHRHVVTVQCSRPDHHYEIYQFNDGGSCRAHKNHQERLGTYGYPKYHSCGSYHFHRDHRKRRDAHNHVSWNNYGCWRCEGDKSHGRRRNAHGNSSDIDTACRSWSAN